MRNNKSNMNKALRCFPACNHDGHRAHSFCGCPITAQIQLSNGDRQELLYIGRVCEVTEPPVFAKDAIFCEHEIESQIITRLHENGDPDKRFLRATVQSEEGTGVNTRVDNISFRAVGSFYYDWVACRWRTHQLHTFEIYVFQKVPDGYAALGRLNPKEEQFEVHSSRLDFNKRKCVARIPVSYYDIENDDQRRNRPRHALPLRPAFEFDYEDPFFVFDFSADIPVC